MTDKTKEGEEKMKITITINKITAEHLKSPHSFTDGCEDSNEVLYLIQKQIDKKLESQRKRRSRK